MWSISITKFTYVRHNILNESHLCEGLTFSLFSSQATVKYIGIFSTLNFKYVCNCILIRSLLTVSSHEYRWPALNLWLLRSLWWRMWRRASSFGLQLVCLFIDLLLFDWLFDCLLVIVCWSIDYLIGWLSVSDFLLIYWMLVYWLYVEWLSCLTHIRMLFVVCWSIICWLIDCLLSVCLVEFISFNSHKNGFIILT